MGGAPAGNAEESSEPAAKLAGKYLKFNAGGLPVIRSPRNAEELYGFERKLERLLEGARPIFREFAEYLRRQRLGSARRLKHVENVCRLERRLFGGRKIEDRSFREFKFAFSKFLEDEHLDNDTKKIYKISLKKFFEFLVSEKSKAKRSTWRKILGFLEDVKIKETEPRIEPLSEEEFRKLYEAAEDIQLRAIISIAYECGPRAGELLTCRIGDVRLHENYAEILVSGKTGQGALLAVRSYGDLVNHLAHHPMKDDPEAPLWFIWRGGEFRPLTHSALNSRLKKLARKAGLKRRIRLHLFRHTAATEKAKFLTDREMCQYFRWSSRSSMPSRYAHLAARDVKPKILSHYTGEQIQHEKVLRCWKCGQPVQHGVKYCSRCGAPVDQSEVVRTAIHVKELEEAVRELQHKLDMLLDCIVKPSLRGKDVRIILDLDGDISRITPEALAKILERKNYVPDLVVMKDDEKISIENREKIVNSDGRLYLYKAYMIGDRIVLEPLRGR